MKSKFLSALTTLALAGAAYAEPLTFDFKDPKGVNNATFTIDALLESTSGSANGISGTVTFDPQNPAATTGTITVTTASLHVPNPMMDGHLHSPMWLDAATYPEIKFVATKLDNVNTSGDTTTADATGTLTIKDVTKTITVPIKLTYLEGKLGQRTPNMKGDLLVLRSHFTVKRSDYNIQAHKNEDKVSDDIQINLSVAGAASRP
jgi:polyisoprenoid-binding protein YceI